METTEVNYRKNLNSATIGKFRVTMIKIMKTRFLGILSMIMFIALTTIFAQCKKTDETSTSPLAGALINTDQYTITQAISDEAQRNTIAFDGLAFLTGCLGSQSFLPPGKVADYSGFQCLRDNDPTKLGHNTSFVTIIAFNVLHILTTDQVNMYVERAENQIEQINAFAYKRYPLLKAFRRLKEGDIPSGTIGLNEDAVLSYFSQLYTLDGQISYDRAKLFGRVIGSFTSEQKAKMDALTELVAKREAVSTELRKFLDSGTSDSSTVIALSQRYGELDGELSYYYATTFTQVWNSLSADQKTKLTQLASQLRYVAPGGGFLYSQPIDMPTIENTDFMFK